ncbi:aspartyl/glutamyl-tRNA amidotransferase subunit A [Paramagnetospirillum marisnigri]|uniref:Glutamyl-tRNA(Gln) amidotransferase subunit A n=1 Tax=Paramagnetospirillum marisnigri TaxID=1285242 RepID=A0A178MVL9_9PROT|nr:Asp-tRNA(Asn)/Glu-tRNA(Gln) amidotransferase subunit GatA [Paramagnetospirillum marisnigri]OAN54587.1 aspartyl/glutamyl-tRNA amidotransferase subunit A [Paramagnetospirillum marisnigri]
MSALIDLTLAGIRTGLAKGEFTATELTRAYLAQMDATRDLNAYITETADRALAAAKDADARLQSGNARPLEGLPLAIKDNFCTKGVLTTAASHILDGFVPPYESTVTSKLWDAGAILLGKTNMDEFAMGSTSGTSYYGAPKNPHKRPSDGATVVPGGSSGGSAVAVAAKTCAAAIGSDTGGSIRQPASLCGVVGIKPTYGRCSRFGIVAYASSLDQAGPITRSVEDAAIVLQAISGHDPKDSTSVPQSVPDFEALLGKGVKGLRIGIPKEYRVAGMPADVERAWAEGIKRLEAAGATVVDVSLPHTKYALAAYYIIAMAEASSNLARYDGLRFGLRVPGKTLDDMYRKTRAEGFGAEVRRRILIGTFVLSAGYYDAYYAKAQKVRALIRDDFLEAFKTVDALLVPTSPVSAFPPGEHAEDPVAMWLVDIYTITVNLAGLPAISVPGGLADDGLPLGLQVIGRPFDEATVLEVGRVAQA